MRTDIADAIDTIDAALFTGDAFISSRNAAITLQENISRWQRELDRLAQSQKVSYMMPATERKVIVTHSDDQRLHIRSLLRLLLQPTAIYSDKRTRPSLRSIGGRTLKFLVISKTLTADFVDKVNAHIAEFGVCITVEDLPKYAPRHSYKFVRVLKFAK